jgi:hypothetical protein
MVSKVEAKITSMESGVDKEINRIETDLNNLITKALDNPLASR